MTKKLIIFLSPVLIVLSSVHYGSPFIIDKLLIVVAITLFLTMLVYASIRDGRISFPYNRFYVPVFLFLAYIVLQVLILRPENQRYIIEPAFLFFLILLFFVYLYSGFGQRENSLNLLRSVIYTNGILLFGYLAMTFGTLVRFKTGEHVFSGWLANHNHLAMLAGMLMPYTIALGIYRHQGVRERILWFTAFFIVLISFLFSVSRGAYISFVLAISITLLASAWLGLYSKKTALLLFGAGVVAGIFILNLYPFEHRIFSSLFIISASQRLGIWLGSLKMFLHHPLIGWGAGTYADAFHRFRPADILYLVNHAHNVFLEAADDTGIIGLGLFVWILTAWIYALIREMRHTSSDFKKAVLWAGLTSTLFLIFHNFVDFGILVPSNAISGILLMAGTASILQINAHDLPLDYVKILSKKQRVLIGILTGIFFVSVTVLCSRAIYGQYLYNRGKDMVTHDNAGQAIKALTSAQRFITTDKLYAEAGNAWYQSFLQSGDTAALDHAIAQFKKAARLCPWNPYYPEDIGGLYQHKGDIKDAIAYTGQSLTLDPSNASLCMRMADLELENGNEDLAILYYKKACSIYHPYTWDALPRLLAYNVSMDKIRRTAAALPDGEWVLANDLISTPRVGLDSTVPTAGELRQGMNVQASAGNGIDTAAGILKGLMLSDPANLKRYLPLFISITPDKRDALSQLEALHLTNPDMLFYEARLQYETGDDASAIDGLKHIIDTDNTYRDAYQLLADILASQNKLDDAIAVLKQGLYYIPSDFVFYAMLGSFYNQERDWYNAVESYRMAVLMNPLYENGYVQMALIYKAQDRQSQAEDIIHKGLDEVPESTQLKQILKEIKY